LIITHPTGAQVRQVWVARYNGGITNGTHQAAALALDNAGNVVVTGSSQNATGSFDYVVLKYDSAGAPLWSTRYTPTNHNGASMTG
jgi:hypothetical protein